MPFFVSCFFRFALETFRNMPSASGRCGAVLVVTCIVATLVFINLVISGVTHQEVKDLSDEFNSPIPLSKR